MLSNNLCAYHVIIYNSLRGRIFVTVIKGHSCMYIEGQTSWYEDLYISMLHFFILKVFMIRHE